LELVAGIVIFAAALFFSTEALERRLDAPQARRNVTMKRKFWSRRRRRPVSENRVTSS
jgi:hypothetical protein